LSLFPYNVAEMKNKGGGGSLLALPVPHEVLRVKCAPLEKMTTISAPRIIIKAAFCSSKCHRGNALRTPQSAWVPEEIDTTFAGGGSLDFIELQIKPIKYYFSVLWPLKLMPN